MYLTYLEIVTRPITAFAMGTRASIAVTLTFVPLTYPLIAIRTMSPASFPLSYETPPILDNRSTVSGICSTRLIASYSAVI